ncbi:MAG: hypothetical protein H6Q69_773 [Firmicutes bacterium]|nr:hypothetical protein [Bacillota bacterium]
MKEKECKQEQMLNLQKRFLIMKIRKMTSRIKKNAKIIVGYCHLQIVEKRYFTPGVKYLFFYKNRFKR